MTEADPWIGRVVDDRYRVVTPLGEGGMGLVYRAEHLKLARPVALKVLQEEFVADAGLRERFDREARALAALAHPNIVTITDYGVAEGGASPAPYLVMELLEGETLHGRLRLGALPPESAVAIARQMLRALAHAHRQGIVHRDLKPGNIFLTPMPDDSDHVTILDFGLARFVDGASRPDEKALTRAGSMLGTPAYMAPEQASGEPSDARTDVYAAGIVLFEMLAGRKPFMGDPSEILRQHLLSPAPSLVASCPSLVGAEPLDRVLARALAKEKRQRFADASEMLAALEDVPVPTVDASAPRPAAPAELATMPTMHASDASKEKVAVPPPTAVTMATPMRVGRAAATPPPSTAARSAGEPLANVKRALVAVGGGLAIAGLIVALVLAAAGGDEEDVPSEAPQTAESAPSEPREAPPAATPAPTIAAPSAPRPSAPAPGPAVATPTLAPGAPPRAAPAEGRPAPANPWAAGVPRELARAKRAADAGREVSVSFDRGLLRYAQLHPDDARPHLVLARAFASRGWRSDAVERYELAARKDPASRGDPRMLTDLVTLTAEDTPASSAAARAVRTIYGAEALAEIDRQLEATRDRTARGRLSRLKQSIEGSGSR